MPLRRTISFTIFTLISSMALAQQGEAPSAPKVPTNWASGNKQGFGTAYEAYDAHHAYSKSSPTAPISKVWFTISQGVLAEVYWPTLDRPQTRTSEFVVTNGKDLIVEEKTQTKSSVEWLQSGVPAFVIRNTDLKDRFTITRTIWTDPDRDVLLQKITIKRHVDGLRFYLIHDATAATIPLGNSARIVRTNGELPIGAYAWQQDHAQALVANIPIAESSVGFVGASDGLRDLRAHQQLKHHYDSAKNGDVLSTLRFEIPEDIGTSEFTLALGFGANLQDAGLNAQKALEPKALTMSFKNYIAGWKRYQSSVRDLESYSSDGGKLFRASVALLKSMEDKTYAGAFVAAPVIPWGVNVKDWADDLKPGESRGKLMTGYHLVWPRDLYHMATCFMAIDEYSEAIASLNYLRSRQYGPKDGEWNFGGTHRRSKDGSFAQNMWIDGTPGWESMQLDEVSMPIILAHRLYKKNKIKVSDYWDMIKRAADFVSDFGPWSPQERWEEQSGLSPSTIATEIAALRSASIMAKAMGDKLRSESYAAKASEWDANFETWLFTTTGKHGNGRYFERIEASSKPEMKWDPNDDSQVAMHNNGKTFLEKDVTDVGFLELVRFGIRPALDSKIADSVIAYDATIRVDLPGYAAPAFYRYIGDRYNNDEVTGQQTEHAMLWPIFTGERGHFELAKAVEAQKSKRERNATIAPYIKATEQMATDHLMIPEQIWDNGDPRMGESTGAATPLGWSHAEYLKLLRSRAESQVFDLQWLK